MSSRTTSGAVVLLLGGHYDATRAPSLQPFIDTASNLVDKVAASDLVTNGAATLDAATLELIERWLSGHFYAQADQMFSQRSTGKASGSFQGQTGMYLENTIYGQQAMILDTTGFLYALQNKGIVGGVWLGKTKTQALSYDDRN